MRKLLILPVFLTMVLWGAIRVSQATVPGEDIPVDDASPKYALPVIVTTAFRESEKFFSTVEEITAQQLKESNATTISQALDLVPGLRTGVARVGHGEYVSLRGYEQQHLLILVDGVPVYNPYDGLLELDHLPIDQIQTIRVIKGPSSCQYGPNSLGGVIHIITKKSLLPPNGETTVQMGENGTYGLRLSSGWQIGPWRLYLSGSRNRSDGFRLPKDFRETQIPDLPGGAGTLSYENGGWRDNSDYCKDAARLNLICFPNERLRLDLSTGLVQNEWGIPPHPIYNPAKNKSLIRYWRFQEWQHGTANLSASARLREHLWIQAGLFYNTYDNTLNGYDDDTYSSQEKPYAFHSIYDDHSMGGQFHLSTMLGRVGTATCGAGLIEDVHRDTPDRGEPTDEYRNQTWWLAIEDIIRLTERISATAGVTGSWLEKKSADRIADLGGDMTSLNPRISLAGLISRNSRIYLSWAQPSRFPTMKQLYGQDGNPYLKLQRSDHVELGGEWSRYSSLQLRGSIFYDHIRHLIEGNYTSPGMLNIPRAHLTGGELILRTQLHSAFDAWLSYSYLQARNESSDRPGNHLQYRPEHQLDWSFLTNCPWSVTIRFHGSALFGQYFYDDFQSGRLSRLAPYAVGNVVLRKRFSFGLEPFLGIENILDTPYQHVYSSPAPGRRFRGGLRMSW